MKPLQKESRIGVMSVVHEGKKPFGLQTYFFEDMVKSVHELDEDIFFFSPLDWKSDSIIVRGFKYIDSEWLETQETIPNIIYDRSFSSGRHQKARIDQCRQFLQESQKTLLNPFGLADLLNDKIEFHSFLIENDIPSLQTYPFEVIKDEAFFETIESSRVYVKPTFGSKGKGIFVIEKTRDAYTLYDNLGKGLCFNTYNALIGDLMIEVSTENYFIQKEARIELFEDAPFDIRVLVQNYGNDYKVTGTAVRLGQKNAVTSNLNSGGRALPIDEMSLFFEEKYNTNVDVLQSDIKNLCLDCTEILRNQFGSFVKLVLMF